MIKSDETETRHMVPRWRSISRSLISGELCSTVSRDIPTEIAEVREQTHRQLKIIFLREKASFSNAPSIEKAEELISKTVLFSQQPDEADRSAANLILDDKNSAKTLRRFAETVLFGLPNNEFNPLPKIEADIRVEIAHRKKLININPRDSRLIGETALLHVNLGQLEKAEDLLSRALALTPNDRYLLRSTARFYVHAGERDRAVWTLARRPVTKFDPWLTSAFLACQSLSEEKIKSLRSPKSLANNGHFSDNALSELRSEIATVELVSGAHRLATGWFRKSSKHPTENTIAQIEWASRQYTVNEERFIGTDFSFSHEAAANKAYADKEWENALAACERWLEYEPFSIRPAILGSFIASIQKSEINRGIILAEKGRLANPSEPILHNNRAVLLAYGGNLPQARESFKNAISNTSSEFYGSITHMATKGLLEMRSGNIEEGVKYYQRAIDRAIEQKDPINCLRAITYFCKEVSEIDWKTSRKMLATAKELEAKFEKKARRIPIDISYTLEALSDENNPLFKSELTHKVLTWPDDEVQKLGKFFEDSGETILLNSFA